MVEVIPIYEERDQTSIPTGNFRLYSGYIPDELPYPDADTLREQYFDNLELMGDDNPSYLGEIYFNGFAHFEWRIGHCLNEDEVLQLIDYLQSCISPVSF